MDNKKANLVKKGTDDINNMIDKIVEELEGYSYSDIKLILRYVKKGVKSKLILQKP